MCEIYSEYPRIRSLIILHEIKFRLKGIKKTEEKKQQSHSLKVNDKRYSYVLVLHYIFLAQFSQYSIYFVQVKK